MSNKKFCDPEPGNAPESEIIGKKEKTKENSEREAEIITMINLHATFLDIDYCKELANDMHDQARRQESLTVLNPSYPQIKNQIIQTQAEALATLCKYVDLLKSIDEMKKKLSFHEEQQSEISKIFL